MSIENQAVEELNNRKFKLYILENNDGKQPQNKDELIKFFLAFKKEKNLKKEQKNNEEYERNARQKIEDEERNKTRTSFTTALIKWMLLIDMGFNLFSKKDENKGRNEAEIASDYYTPQALNFLKSEHEKKSINSSQNNHDC